MNSTRLNSIRLTIALVAIAATLVAAVTGLGGKWLHGAPTGWMLVGHVGSSAVLMLALAAVALVEGRRHRFDYVPRAGQRAIDAGRKWLFWLLLLCALASMGSMLAAMLPVFSYTGMAALTAAHELAGIGLLAAGGLYLLAGLLARRGSGSAGGGAGDGASAGT